MGKFDGVLICSDIDGTLTDSCGKISTENCRAIEYFQSEGGMFTVSTGRYHNFIEKFPVFFPDSVFRTIIGLCSKCRT